MNSFFCSVFTKEDLSDIPYLEPHQIDYKLHSVEITVDGVLGKLNNLNVSKSQGPDQIHPRVLFEARNEIVVALVIIFGGLLLNALFLAIGNLLMLPLCLRKGADLCLLITGQLALPLWSVKFVNHF